MKQPEVANEASYTNRTLPPQHRTWYRRAYNDRKAGVAKATISTFLGTKIDSTSRTDILDDIDA